MPNRLSKPIDRARDPRSGSFGFVRGQEIAGAYLVDAFLGGGWEGEVYRLIERRTGSSRAMKVFHPARNVNDRALDFYARKLEELRGCELLIAYHHTERIRRGGQIHTALISEYVEGELLERFVARRRGQRLPDHEALCLLHRLAAGLEPIHARRGYHGDLHAGNVLVRRRGVRFDVKLVDLHDLGRWTRATVREDLANLIRLFYDMLGGRPRYASVRPEFKWIIGGLKRTLIERRFPTATALREHLESFEWTDER